MAENTTELQEAAEAFSSLIGDVPVEETATEEKCAAAEPEVKNPFWFDMSGQLLGGMADKWRGNKQKIEE